MTAFRELCQEYAAKIAARDCLSYTAALEIEVDLADFASKVITQHHEAQKAATVPYGHRPAHLDPRGQSSAR